MSVPGPKILLLGPSGTGKTHSIRTLVEAGLETFVIFTEPGQEVLSDVPASKLHWCYLPPVSASWNELRSVAENINRFTYENLTKMQDLNRQRYDGMLRLYSAMANFKCDRTGQEFGAVDSWGLDRAIVIDSLTGLNEMAMSLVVGGKPTKAQNEWGLAMDQISKFITLFTTSVRCTGAVIGHVEREVDEVGGGIKLMVSTLGRKLAPTLPRFFSDAVYAQRKGDKFSWSTVADGVDLKARNLPWADNLPPSFVPLIKRWKDRQAEAGPVVLQTQP